MDILPNDSLLRVYISLADDDEPIKFVCGDKPLRVHVSNKWRGSNHYWLMEASFHGKKVSAYVCTLKRLSKYKILKAYDRIGDKLFWVDAIKHLQLARIFVKNGHRIEDFTIEGLNLAQLRSRGIIYKKMLYPRHINS